MHKDFSDLFFQNLHHICFRDFFIFRAECFHPVCMFGNFFVASDIFMIYQIVCQDLQFFFQSGWKDCQSHYFDQADVFFLDVMILSMRVIYPQWMFFCRNIITQGKIQFEHAVPHSCDRSDRIVWLSICIRIDECIFICIVSPASEDMICQIYQAFLIFVTNSDDR